MAANELAGYDALGNNVGLYNPYVPAYQPPLDDSGAIDFGGGSYGGGANGLSFPRKYYMDGLPVTEEYFMIQINSGLIGGAFGLLEMSARMSAQFAGHSVRTSHGTIERNYGNDFSRAAGEALESNTMTVYRNFTINESWSIAASLIPLAQQQTQTRQTRQTSFNLGTKGVAFTSEEKSALNEAFKHVNSKKCLDWINKILEPSINAWDEAGQKGGTPVAVSAQDLISKAFLNKYNDSLTAEQMGISSKDREEIRNQDGYFQKFVGVTVKNQVWLHQTAFKIQSLSEGTDLPANIVHEILHVFGFKDPYVASLNKEIQENCGWGGYINGN